MLGRYQEPAARRRHNVSEQLWRGRCIALDLIRSTFQWGAANSNRHNTLKTFSITECCGSRGKCPILGKHRLTMLTFDQWTRLFSCILQTNLIPGTGQLKLPAMAENLAAELGRRLTPWG